MNNLIIFDVDGTLIDVSDYEEVVYTKAVHETVGKIQIDTKWDNYKYSTDAGVFSEIIESTFARSPSMLEERAVERHFVRHLKDVFLSNYPLCQCISGAENLFAKIKNIGWDVAIATGCWKGSAELKLKNANIMDKEIPLANSSDCYDRKDIIKVAIERAKAKYQKSDYAKMIYVGDKLWDKNAASNLAIGFIGIGKMWSEIAKGAFFHVPDYSTDKFIDYLDTLT